MTRGGAFKLRQPGAGSKAGVRPFVPATALRQADAVLQAPPAWFFTERHAPKGSLVYRAAIPLRLAPTGNAMRHAKPFALGKWKSDCLWLMRAQLVTAPTSPLTSRAQVLAIRFTSRAPDGYADFGKIPVDCLVKLGLIRDDNQSCIELRQWPEKAPPGEGFCVIAVYTGAG